MRRSTRPPVVQDAVVEHVRSRIISGRLRPGERLPPRVELARRFSTTAVTIQRAFARLAESGFVRADGPRGTFVSERPPHAYRYALAFPLEPGDPGWVRFWTVIANVAREAERAGPFAFAIRTGVDRGRPGEGYRALLEDVEEKRLAGIVFATNPFLVRDTPILDAPWPPRVAIMPPPAPRGVTALDLDHAAFVARALDALAERGRRRVAFVTVPGVPADRFESLEGQLASRGMTARKEWVQAVPQSDPAWAANLALLMFRGDAAGRPDGLVVTDDNLVEHVSSGLVEAGVRVPEELDVIAHCNFPAPAPSVLRVTRLGYDIRGLIRTCVALLERRRQGREVEHAVLGPVFESELPAESPAVDAPQVTAVGEPRETSPPRRASTRGRARGAAAFGHPGHPGAGGGQEGARRAESGTARAGPAGRMDEGGAGR